MFAISSILGSRYYPIPYRWGRLGCILILMGAIYEISLILPAMPLALKLAVHTILIGIYGVGTWFLIRKK